MLQFFDRNASFPWDFSTNQLILTPSSSTMNFRIKMDLEDFPIGLTNWVKSVSSWEKTKTLFPLKVRKMLDLYLAGKPCPGVEDWPYIDKLVETGMKHLFAPELTKNEVNFNSFPRAHPSRVGRAELSFYSAFPRESNNNLHFCRKNVGNYLLPVCSKIPNDKIQNFHPSRILAIKSSEPHCSSSSELAN